VTVAPGGRVSVAAWGGYLFDHDPLEPGLGMQRWGASVMTANRGISGGAWSSSIVWGLNVHHHSDREHTHDPTVSTKLSHPSSSVLVESTLELGRSTAVFGRAEQVQKSGDDLGFIGGDLIELFTVRSLSAGVTRDVRSFGDAAFGVGAGVARFAAGDTPADVWDDDAGGGCCLRAAESENDEQRDDEERDDEQRE
jgi:hypothetical protein